MWGDHIQCRLKIVVTSMCAKFCLGLLVRLWPDWIVQLACASFGWHTIVRRSILRIDTRIACLSHIYQYYEGFVTTRPQVHEIMKLL